MSHREIPKVTQANRFNKNKINFIIRSQSFKTYEIVHALPERLATLNAQAHNAKRFRERWRHDSRIRLGRIFVICRFNANPIKAQESGSRSLFTFLLPEIQGLKPFRSRSGN